MLRKPVVEHLLQMQRLENWKAVERGLFFLEDSLAMHGGSVSALVPEELVLFAHFAGATGQHKRSDDKGKDIPNDGVDHVSSWVNFNYVGFAALRSVARAQRRNSRF